MSELAVAIKQIEAADAVVDAIGDAVRREILDFCIAHDDALFRTCLPGHLTGSALVIDPSARRVLLLHHAKLDRWLQPGGHADGDGNLGRVALREAEEETGLNGLELVEPAIDLDIHEIPERGDEPAHLHLDVRFLVLTTTDTEVAINHEAFDARWISPDDPDGLIEGAELHRLIQRGLQRMASL
ncbi:MAG: 8-oxo-dGTP pyrophosphatase MutT (NUDIX family) [Acidimicrobiales bacterium]|jgi:8-oxo-dGTP pyrophosphatase MutT (NUDIX family)